MFDSLVWWLFDLQLLLLAAAVGVRGCHLKRIGQVPVVAVRAPARHR
jgi:hypothetical protein